MKKEQPNFYLLDHTSDIGLQVHGTDLPDLFQNAGQALVQIMLKGNFLQSVSLTNLSLRATDHADLMVRWLGEILYIFQAEKRIATGFHIAHLSPFELTGQLTTITFNPAIHEILYEIKAITYHQIEVVHKGKQWHARVILDI